MSAVTSDIKGGVAVVTVSNPPVNAISEAVRAGLLSAVTAADADETVDAIVIHCEGRTFMAGADIREFGHPPKEPHLPDVVNAIEATDTPVIAAIHGSALGGGFEIALGCDYRIALSSARVGLPEVSLGLIPGAGGTQRLPRLIGIETALEIMLSTKPINALNALALGAVDKVVDDDLIGEAIDFAKKQVGNTPRRCSEMYAADADNADDIFTAAAVRNHKCARGQFAPTACLKAVKAALSDDFSAGLAVERGLFLECSENPQSRAMQHMFFAERQVARVPGIGKEVTPRQINEVGIVGAGTMGGGIAMAFADAGIPVILIDTTDEVLAHGLETVKKNYSRMVTSGYITEEGMNKRMGLIRTTTSYETLRNADLVIEAVFEDIDVKQAVFTRLDAVMKEGAILASNTSYLDLNAIAAFTKRPEDVVGLHFFSPANIMKLLEVIRGDKTPDDVVATSLALAKRIGKIAVVAGVCHGFIGNRMLSVYGREAAKLVIEGATPKTVDTALYTFGMPMGLFSVIDMAGLDIGYKNRQALGRDAYDTVAFDWIDALVEQGRLGQKSGAGIYAYEKDSRIPKEDEAVLKLIEEKAKEAGITRRTISDEEITERCIYGLINEAAKILEEGIALRASDIDVVYCAGYGFPRHLGGPLHYADQIGLAKIYATVESFSADIDERWWKPSSLLKTLAESDATFAAYDQQQR